jgi:hypothetical protein
MAEQEPDKSRDLATILEDVKTIKAILQNQDAPLPPVWKLLYFVAVPTLVLVSLLKFFVPALAAMSFIDTFLWLWLPLLALVAVIIATGMVFYLRKRSKRFMAQGRVQIFLYTRLILAPAILTVGYLLSLNSTYSMDGAMAVLIAMGMTQVVVLMPREFRPLPFVFLFGGWAELAFDLRGAVWTMVNTLSMATAMAWIGFLLQKGEDHQEGR